MRIHVPSVEVADDADARGIRCPHAEDHAAFDDVRAELLPELVMRTFVEEMKVPVGQQRALRSRGDFEIDARYDIGADRLQLMHNHFFSPFFLFSYCHLVQPRVCSICAAIEMAISCG